MKHLLTTTQAAAELGIAPTSVRKLVERGDLKATRFGSQLAFTPADVQRAKSRPGRGRPATGKKRAVA